MSFDEFYNNYVLDVVLVHGAMFLKASLHGLKRKAGGLGGAQPPPLADTTFLSRILMGSVLAGRMILEAIANTTSF